jgi:hypothetical protein
MKRRGEKEVWDGKNMVKKSENTFRPRTIDVESKLKTISNYKAIASASYEAALVRCEKECASANPKGSTDKKYPATLFLQTMMESGDVSYNPITNSSASNRVVGHRATPGPLMPNNGSNDVQADISWLQTKKGFEEMQDYWLEIQATKDKVSKECGIDCDFGFSTSPLESYLETIMKKFGNNGYSKADCDECCRLLAIQARGTAGTLCLKAEGRSVVVLVLSDIYRYLGNRAGSKFPDSPAPFHALQRCINSNPLGDKLVRTMVLQATKQFNCFAADLQVGLGKMVKDGNLGVLKTSHSELFVDDPMEGFTGVCEELYQQKRGKFWRNLRTYKHTASTIKLRIPDMVSIPKTELKKARETSVKFMCMMYDTLHTKGANIEKLNAHGININEISEANKLFHIFTFAPSRFIPKEIVLYSTEIVVVRCILEFITILRQSILGRIYNRSRCNTDELRSIVTYSVTAGIGTAAVFLSNGEGEGAEQRVKELVKIGGSNAILSDLARAAISQMVSDILMKKQTCTAGDKVSASFDEWITVLKALHRSNNYDFIKGDRRVQKLTDGVSIWSPAV